jgi:isoquinoline 1-oxidoreductase beta subunit
MGIPGEKVDVNVTLLGGGFGRRLQQDFASEAGALAKIAGVSLRLMVSHVRKAWSSPRRMVC